ncbi:MAG: hypothetical protein ABIW80_04715 [Lapillicoccus sp.]
METVGRTRDELARQGAAFREAGQHLGPVTAKDGSGAVTVTLDPQGRLTQILVSMTWRQHLSPQTLAAAVNDAMTAAGVERMNTWGADVAQAADRAVSAPTPLPADDLAQRLSEAAAADGSGVVESSMQTMRDQLRELVDGIEDVKRDIQAHLAREFAGRSPSGHAKATIAGNGSVVDLSFDRGWLESAHANNIGREALQAIQDAYQQLSGHDVQAIVDRSQLGEMHRLSQDPRAMARAFGLRP